MSSLLSQIEEIKSSFLEDKANALKSNDFDTLKKIMSMGDNTILASKNLDELGELGGPAAKYSENLTDILAVDEDRDFSSVCGTQGAKTFAKTDTAGKVYENSTSDNDPTANKSEKWNAIISNRDYMDCSSSGREVRAFKIYKLCNNATSPNCIENKNQKDEIMYIGRAQMSLNNGKKRKYLYFQSDFRLKP